MLPGRQPKHRIQPNPPTRASRKKQTSNRREEEQSEVLQSTQLGASASLALRLGLHLQMDRIIEDHVLRTARHRRDHAHLRRKVALVRTKQLYAS